MSKPEDAQLIQHRTVRGNRAAIVFVHGFGGDASATWGKFPQLLKEASQLEGWNICSVGYPTRLRLDLLAGIWSANPDLVLLALGFETACKSTPLDTCESLAIIAHSMGGLLVQRALLDYPALLQRVSHLFLFGTPSGGLEKASIFQRLKRQIRDMSPESPFILDVRKRWRNRFGVSNQGALSFSFWCVAGLEDEFVPYQSSLGVFPPEIFPNVQFAAVPGNHIQIVKPADASNRGVQLVLKAILGRAAPAGPWSSAAVALESRNFNQAVKELQPNRSKLDDDALVQLALALDGLDRSAEALEVLETRNASAGASAQLDAMGVLAGRLKRRWLAEKRKDDAERAEQFYAEGFAQAEKAQDHEMAYYLGINVAFMQLAARKDRAAARAIAEKVLAHCAAAKPGMWCSATQGEAKLVLGKTQPALQSYLHAVGSKPKPTPRQMESMYHQAMKVADLMNDTDATSGLDTIFRPS